jgi:hypothetical protein
MANVRGDSEKYVSVKEQILRKAATGHCPRYALEVALFLSEISATITQHEDKSRKYVSNAEKTWLAERLCWEHFRE